MLWIGKVILSTESLLGKERLTSLLVFISTVNKKRKHIETEKGKKKKSKYKASDLARRYLVNKSRIVYLPVYRILL